MEQEGSRCVLTAHGGPFVVSLGMILMLQLLVDNQDTHLMVRDAGRLLQSLRKCLNWTFFFYFLGAFALSREYQTNIWPPVIRNLTCMGNESSLFNCTYSLVDNNRACAYYASIICQGKSTLASVIVIIIK